MYWLSSRPQVNLTDSHCDRWTGSHRDPRWTATEGVLALIATPGGLRLTHNATGGLALIVTPGGLQLKVYWLSSRPQVNLTDSHCDRWTGSHRDPRCHFLTVQDHSLVEEEAEETSLAHSPGSLKDSLAHSPGSLTR